MKKINGLTLVELVVTLVIATILIGFGVPSSKSLYEHTRADSQIRKLQQSLTYARNQAISYGAKVTMCPLQNGRCHKDWQNGYSIFLDSFPTSSFDSNDTLIFKSQAFTEEDTVIYNRLAIRFQPEGLASGTNGTLKYCPGNASSEYSRAVIISQSGRVRYSKDKAIVCE